MKHARHLLFAGIVALVLLTSGVAQGQIAFPSSGHINTIVASSSLYNPASMAVDRRNGTIYFIDSLSGTQGSPRVVKAINPTTGSISVYAGGGYFANNSQRTISVNGQTVYCGPLLIGDGGPATSAMLSSPQALTVDQYGNLYIADSSRVLEVTTNGIINTLVGNGCPADSGDGGPAASAMIDLPMGVAVDSYGDVFISAWYDSYVREIVATGSNAGNIVAYAGYLFPPNIQKPPTYCGTGVDATQAVLVYPEGLAVDANNVLYIADYSSGRVRKVVPGTSSSPSNCTGLVGTSGHLIYDVATSLSNPAGVALDTAGNLYITDTGANTILKMLLSVANTPIYTIAGNGIAGFAGDGGLATSAELGGSDGFQSTTIALDANNNLYIDDVANDSIRVVSPSTIVSASCSPNPIAYGSDTTCTATFPGSSSPTGTVTWSLDGSVWKYSTVSGGSASVNGFTAVSAGTHTIQAAYGGDANNLSGFGGTTVTIKALQTISFTAPTSPVTYGNAALTLSATATSGLPVVFSIVSGPGQVSGSSLTLTGPGTVVVAANQAGSATYEPAPQVTQTVVVNYAIPAHGLITTIAGNGTAGYTGDGGFGASAELNAPWGVNVDRSGNVYIADANNVAIRAISYTNGYIYTEAGSGLGGNGVAVTPSGYFYIANTGYNRLLIGEPANGTINYYLVAGNINDTAGYSGDGGTAPSSLLNGPESVALDSSGNVYIADTKNSRIRKITASTDIITTVAGNGTAGYTGDAGSATGAEINNPYGVAVDASGNIYIADTLNNRIRKVTIATGTITTVAGTGTYGYNGDGGAATSAELYLPTGVALDSSGNIYIADYGNNRIRKVTVSTGYISTVAGNGVAGFSGDNGSATGAELCFPAGVAVDASGNIYIADASNNRVRVVGH